ncbi:uncharacterized protein [Saccopteryx leptura]|uniref:uncharacterized protein isoform X2 n=1 Tax=Saccopteryx leptura TaxID=249018 RepID=UPI00339C6B77
MQTPGLCNCSGGLQGLPDPQAVYLLLVLFREVTALHQSCNASLHPKPETASLPTMPEDLQAQATNWQGLEHVRWYKKTQTELRLAMCWEARPPAPNWKFLTNSCPRSFSSRPVTHSPGHAFGSGAQPAADGPLPRPELRSTEITQGQTASLAMSSRHVSLQTHLHPHPRHLSSLLLCPGAGQGDHQQGTWLRCCSGSMREGGKKTAEEILLGKRCDLDLLRIIRNMNFT